MRSRMLQLGLAAAAVLALAVTLGVYRGVIDVLLMGTIRNYLAAITQKLDAGSRAKAYRIARDLGWI